MHSILQIKNTHLKSEGEFGSESHKKIEIQWNS